MKKSRFKSFLKWYSNLDLALGFYNRKLNRCVLKFVNKLRKLVRASPLPPQFKSAILKTVLNPYSVKTRRAFRLSTVTLLVMLVTTVFSLGTLRISSFPNVFQKTNNRSLEAKTTTGSTTVEDYLKSTSSGDKTVLSPVVFEQPISFADKFTSDDVIYGLIAGSGIGLTEGADDNSRVSEQTPIISNTGVLSLGGKTGALALEAGAGIGIEGLKIKNGGVVSINSKTGDVSFTASDGIDIDGTSIRNTDGGSDQSIFKNIAVSGQNSISASLNTDTLTFVGSTGLDITTDSTNKKLTFTNSTGFTDDGTVVRLTTITDNVGIGTTAPSQKLDVQGAVYLAASSPSSTTYSLYNSSGTLYWNGLAVSGSGGVLPTGITGNTLRYDGANWVVSSLLYNDGTNVGIGTTSPTHLLHIVGGSANFGVTVMSGGTAMGVGDIAVARIFGPDNTLLALLSDGNITINIDDDNNQTNASFSVNKDTGATQLFRVEESGNVGIGNTSPATLLDVNGTAWLRGTAGGTGGLYVKSDGNVGVGTTSPSGKLTIVDNGSFASPLFQVHADDETPYLAGYYNDTKSTSLATMSYFGLNTGDFYFVNQTSESINFSQGGYASVKMIIKAGNVGIGTASPTEKLSIGGAISVQHSSAQGVIHRGTVNGSYGLSLQGNTNTTVNDTYPGAYIVVGGGTLTDTYEGNISLVAYGAAIDDGNRNTIRFYNRSGTNTVSERMRITSTGNVGIGSTSPQAKLTINGTTEQLRLSYDTSNYQSFTVGSTGDLFIAQDGGAATLALTNGSVGIGTTGPGSRLTVNDNGTTGTYLLTVHADDENPYLTGYYNDTYSSTTPVMRYFGYNTGRFDFVGNATLPINFRVAGGSPFLTMLDGNLGLGGTITDTSTFAGASMVIKTGNVGIGTTSPGAKLHVVGNITVPGSGTQSEVFGAVATATNYSTALGYNAVAGGTDYNVALGHGAITSGAGGGVALGAGASALTLSVAVGRNANASSNTSTTAIGYAASAGGASSTAVGRSANASVANAIAIGDFSAASGQNAVALGRSSSATHFGTALGGQSSAGYNPSIAIGQGATTTGTNQLVIGASGYSISSAYIGNGVTNASPSNFTLNATGGSGTDIAGGTLYLAGGRGTGAGAGGAIIFQTSAAGASGTTLRSLSDRMIIDTSGNVGIGSTSPGARLDISDGGVSNQLTFLFGADNTATTRTNNTLKAARFGFPHYLTAEESVTFANMASSSTDNEIDFGGGSSVYNAATILSFYTAANYNTLTGTERMRITNAGNVGIGTTAPFSYHASGNKGLDISDATSPMLVLSRGTSGAGQLYVNSGNDLVFNVKDGASTSINAMVIDSTNGNVGIGTTAPTALLHLGIGSTATIGQKIVLASGATANAFEVNTSTGVGGDKFVIKADGNVGIGTTSPTKQLSIAKSGGDIINFDPTSNGINISNSNSLNFSIIASNALYLGAAGDTSKRWSINSVGALLPADGAFDLGTAANPVGAIYTNGSVGIGTTGPAQALEISRSSGFSVIKLTNTGTLANDYAGYQMKHGGSSNLWQMLVKSDGSYVMASVSGVAPDYMAVSSAGNIRMNTDTDAGYKLDVNGTVRATGTITTTGTGSNLVIAGTGNSSIAGNVGIGTTNPSQKLEVAGNIELGAVADRALMFGSVYNAFKFDSSAGAMLLSGGDSAIYIDSNNNTTDGKFIIAKDSTVYGSGTELFRVQENGNVGIGTTNPLRKLEVNGSIRMGPLITGAGTAVAVYRDVNGDLADSTSSIRYKDEVIPYESVLDRVLSLQAVRFNWGQNTSTPGLGDFGMIAEQVNTYLPDLVTYEADGVTPHGLKYEKMGVFAIKAIQEQQVKLTALSIGITDKIDNISQLKEVEKSFTDKAATLSAKLASMESRLAFIEDNVLGASSSARLLEPALGDGGQATLSALLVTGKTNLNDLGVIGTISAGTLIIDGADNSINSLTDTLKIQPSALAGVDFLGGKVTIDQKGNMKVEAEITAKKYNVQVGDTAAASIGEAVIPAGETKIKIKTTSLTSVSKIFVEPIDQPVATSVSRIDDTTFEIRIKESLDQELKLNWWIVN